jgi:hypothetical protein
MKKFWFVTVFIMILFMAVTGCSREKTPPEAVIKINHIQVEAAKGTYEWQYGFLYHSALVADATSPSVIAKHLTPLTVHLGAFAKISFSNHSHPHLYAHIWENDREGKKLFIKQNQLTLPSEPGRYVILLHARWPHGNSDYVFSVDVH